MCGAGYHFSFPFLGQEVLDTCQDCVHPLYQHMMTPRYGPSLSFIGLPLLVAPFLMFSLQSMYIARMLSGKVQPPHTSDMHTWIDKNHTNALEAGVKPRHIHLMNTAQWEFLRWVADQAGALPFSVVHPEQAFRHCILIITSKNLPIVLFRPHIRLL